MTSTKTKYKRVEQSSEPESDQTLIDLPTVAPFIMLMIIVLSFITIFVFKFDAVSSQDINRHHDVHKSRFQSTKPEYFQLQMDPEDRIRLFWSLDYKKQLATIEFRAVLDHPYDWVAIGFSDYGNSSHADFCMLYYDAGHKPHFVDTWTDEDSNLMIDEQNDCILLNYARKGSTIRVVYQRKFNTCDEPFDYVIEEGTTHLLYAMGRGPFKKMFRSSSSSSRGSHSTKINLKDHLFGFQRTRFLKKLETRSPELRKLPSDIKMVQVNNSRVVIPSDETTYHCSLHLLPEDFKKKNHVIQYEADIQKGNEAFVHHMEVFHCEVSDADVKLPDWNKACSDPTKPKILENCKRVLAAWAMGAGPLVYPEEAGLPVGGSNYSRYVMLEIHYNNPDHKSGIIDSSGIRMYYSERLRKHDVGVLEIGLEYSDKNSIPPKELKFDLKGFCVSECTRIGLPSPDGITIFASQLHTHLTGVRVWTQHIKGGIELPELNRDNHYSQHFQEIRLLKDPVKFLPGDSLITTCRYDTSKRSNMTLGGYAISEEMCVNYMHYYPKTDLEVCKSSIDTRILSDFFDYMRDFESDDTDGKRYGISKNYFNIKWSKNKSQMLKKLYDESPLDMQCNRSSGERFPGNWNAIPVTKIYQPLEHVKDTCGSGENSHKGIGEETSPGDVDGDVYEETVDGNIYVRDE